MDGYTENEIKKGQTASDLFESAEIIQQAVPVELGC